MAYKMLSPEGAKCLRERAFYMPYVQLDFRQVLTSRNSTKQFER